MSESSALSKVLFTCGLGLSVGVLSCTSKANASAVSPERESEASYNLGVEAFQRGSYREALEEANKAVKLDSQNADAQLLVATVYIGMCTYTTDDCRLPEAEKFAREALRLRKDFRPARNTLGSILINEKKYDEAIATLEPLTQDILYANPETAWGNLGWAYLEKGDLDRAINALQHSVSLEPRFCWGHDKLAQALAKKGDWQTAEAEASAAMNPAFPTCKTFTEAYETRAQILAHLGRAEEARADLQQCVHLGSGTAYGRRCKMALDTSHPSHP